MEVESEGMDAIPYLTDVLQKDILHFLKVDPTGDPDVRLLDNLVSAYTRCVPWESAFRIVKRASHRSPANCPRLPEEFWIEAIEKGGGGTCFESNYAFFALLTTLGYVGYLTINDMGDSTGCHAAIVLKIDDQLWLADVGLPVYTPLVVNNSVLTSRDSRFHSYTVAPDGEMSFQIERDRHPLPYCYTLINRPVSDLRFREAIMDDYGPEGLFLDRVIINKVIGGCAWRFSSGERLFHLEKFMDGNKETIDLPDGEKEAAAALSQHFSMDEDTIYSALKLTSSIQNGSIDDRSGQDEADGAESSFIAD